MPMFEWDEKLSVGNQMIDEHHMHLLNLINISYDMVTEGATRGQVESVLSEITAYALYHFHCEECWMLGLAYPESTEHRRTHEDFILRMLELQRDFDQGGTTTAENILSFLVDWFVTHIMVADVKCGKFAAASSAAQGCVTA